MKYFSKQNSGDAKTALKTSILSKGSARGLNRGKSTGKVANLKKFDMVRGLCEAHILRKSGKR